MGPSEWAYGKAVCKVRRKCGKCSFHLVPKRGGILHHAPGRSFEAWHSRPGGTVQCLADSGAQHSSSDVIVIE